MLLCQLILRDSSCFSTSEMLCARSGASLPCLKTSTSISKLNPICSGLSCRASMHSVRISWMISISNGDGSITFTMSWMYIHCYFSSFTCNVKNNGWVWYKHFHLIYYFDVIACWPLLGTEYALDIVEHTKSLLVMHPLYSKVFCNPTVPSFERLICDAEFPFYVFFPKWHFLTSPFFSYFRMYYKLSKAVKYYYHTSCSFADKFCTRLNLFFKNSTFFQMFI